MESCPTKPTLAESNANEHEWTMTQKNQAEASLQVRFLIYERALKALMAELVTVELGNLADAVEEQNCVSEKGPGKHKQIAKPSRHHLAWFQVTRSFLVPTNFGMLICSWYLRKSPMVWTTEGLTGSDGQNSVKKMKWQWDVAYHITLSYFIILYHFYVSLL